MRSSVLIPTPLLSPQCTRTMPPQSPFSWNPSHCSARPYHQTAIHLWGICCTEMSLYVGLFHSRSVSYCEACPPIFHDLMEKTAENIDPRFYIWLGAGLRFRWMIMLEYFNFWFGPRIEIHSGLKTIKSKWIIHDEHFSRMVSQDKKEQ